MLAPSTPLRRSFPSLTREEPPAHIDIGERRVSLHIIRHPRARRFTIRYDGRRECVTLSLPRRAPLRDGLAFLSRRTQWLQGQIEKQPPKIAFVPGVRLPLLGKEYTVLHAPQRRGTVVLDDKAIHVCGAEEHFSRRLTDWLKEHARRELSVRVIEKAALIAKKPRRVSVRDMRSRWGSCSTDGRLVFSWRLILAPPIVLDYLVCHEVAHLAEMNHGVRFWRLVESLCPQMQEARRWLRAHSHTLYAYGA